MAGPPPLRPTIAPSPCLASALYRLTVRQFERMIEDGTIAEDARVELIEGLVVARSSRNRSYIQAGNKALRILWRMIPTGWHVAKSVPIVASDWSKPESDLVVVRGEMEDYEGRDIGAVDVALVVEIAVTVRAPGLLADRTDMARIYAGGGIPVYWIINLVDGQIEVLSEPGRDGYRMHQVFGPGQDVPVVVAGVEAGWVAVAALLP